MKSLFASLLLCLRILPTLTRAEFNYTVAFDSPEPDPNFTAQTVGPDLATPPGTGFGISTVAGELRMARSADGSNGAARYFSTFQLLGNFETQAKGSRPRLGMAEAGLVGASSLGFFDSFFSSMNSVNAVIVMQGAPDRGIGSPNSIETGTFRLRRVGTTLFAEFDSGGGFSTLLNFTDPNYAGPFSIGLFLLQVHGTVGANEVTFDDFVIRSDGVIPVLNIASAGNDVLLSWPKGATDFVLEAGTEVPAGLTWLPVVATVETAGQQSVVRQPASENTRFFRLAARGPIIP